MSIAVARQPSDVVQHDLTLRAEADTILAKANPLMEDLTEFQSQTTKAMGRVQRNVLQYLDTYRQAYDAVSEDLGIAKQEAAQRDALISAVSGIVIGTGVGLVLPRLIDGIRALRVAGELPELTLAAQTVAEATGETIEAGAAQVLAPQSGPFELPPDLSADLNDSTEWQQLAAAWKTLAEVAPSITAFANARAELSDSAQDNAGADVLRAQIRRWTAGNTIAGMQAAFSETEDAMAVFLAAMDSPILNRDAYAIGQDLLVKWMASLTPATDPDADDLDPIDDAETVLAKWGLIRGPSGVSLPAKDTRLGVDFGEYWTSDDDQLDAYHAALYEQGRMRQLGRLGVITHAASGDQPALVLLQHDLYDTVGLPDPRPSEIEWRYACITYGEPLTVGDVVTVSDLKPRMVVVSPLRGAPAYPVRDPLRMDDTRQPAVHPRTARRREEERQRKAAEEERRKRLNRIDYGPVPVDPVDLGRRGLDPEELRYVPDEVLTSVYGLPPRRVYGPELPPEPDFVSIDDAPAPEDDANGECIRLPPEEVDTSVSPDDPFLDPDARELCFGPLAAP